MPINTNSFKNADLSTTSNRYPEYYTFSRTALFNFLLDNPRIWTQKNRRNPPEKRDASYGCYGVDPATLRPSLLNLEPDQNAAPNRSPLRVQAETAFLTKNSGLEIEKIACVDHRLGVEWKTEIRQALRNEDA